MTPMQWECNIKKVLNVIEFYSLMIKRITNVHPTRHSFLTLCLFTGTQLGSVAKLTSLQLKKNNKRRVIFSQCTVYRFNTGFYSFC